MLDLARRTALVTGGASGIGLGMAKAFARAGTRVAIADVSEDHLDAAVAMARNQGLDLMPVKMDVRDEAAWETAADAIEAALGPVSILALNAGVGAMARVQDAGYAEWDWILDVNVSGVMNGVRLFLPRIRRRQEGGHIIATASVGGLLSGNVGGIYGASKSTVVAAMQALREDVTSEGIGVSVLCPGVVNTNIHKPYDTRRPEDVSPHYVLTTEATRTAQAMLSQGMSPDEVGEIVLGALRRNDLYIMTHDVSQLIIQRRDALLVSMK